MYASTESLKLCASPAYQLPANALRRMFGSLTVLILQHPGRQKKRCPFTRNGHLREGEIWA